MEIYNGTYCVYMHTNTINGKKYVGVTKHGDQPQKRWGSGRNYDSNTHFAAAIKKYGWDSFDHEILASHLTQEEALKFERLLVIKLDLTNQDKGYNLTEGGDGLDGVFNQNLKKGVREAAKVCAIPVHQYSMEDGHYIASYPSASKAGEITGANVSVITYCCRNKFRQGGGFYWSHDKLDYYVSPVVPEKQGLKVYQLSLEGEPLAEYDSMVEAARANNCSLASINGAVRGGRAGRYRSYLNSLWTDGTFEPLLKNPPKNHRAVRCIETGDVYETVAEASRAIGCSGMNIRSAARGDTNTAGGYTWEYLEDANTALKKIGKRVKRVEGDIVYNSIADAVQAEHLSKNTLKRHIANGTPLNGCHYKYIEQ